MKKLVIIATAILFMTGYTASAQMMGQNNMQNQKQGMMMQKGGMMQGGMMQGMMGNGMCPMCGQMMMGQNMPMKKYGMMVNRLPNMQEQLSLSDEQVETLLDLQTEFKKQQIDYQAELRKKQMKMKSLLADNAPVSQVKNQMEACSETKINMKAAAYETAGKMKAVLNSDQKEQLKNNMMQGGGMMNQGQGGMMNQGQGGMMQNRGGMMQNQNNQ